MLIWIHIQLYFIYLRVPIYKVKVHKYYIDIIYRRYRSTGYSKELATGYFGVTVERKLKGRQNNNTSRFNIKNENRQRWSFNKRKNFHLKNFVKDFRRSTRLPETDANNLINSITQVRAGFCKRRPLTKLVIFLVDTYFCN